MLESASARSICGEWLTHSKDRAIIAWQRSAFPVATGDSPVAIAGAKANQEECRVAMEIDLPDVVAEVTEVFARYEQALCANDIDTLDSLFWKNPLTLRYGPNGTLIGHAKISAFRRARNINGMERQLQNTAITTFGRDFAIANTESTRPGSDRVFRQSQTWVRLPQGWRIVAAHVSDIAG